MHLKPQRHATAQGQMVSQGKKSSRRSKPVIHVHPCVPVWSWGGQYLGTAGSKERKSLHGEGSSLGPESTRESARESHM